MPAIAFDDEDILRAQELVSVGDTALKLLEQLPAVQRDAVRARVVDELLGRELGHSQQVVRQHVSRARARSMHRAFPT